jgi:hypothetical protein
VIDPVRWTLAIPLAVLAPLCVWWVLKHGLLIQLPSGMLRHRLTGLGSWMSSSTFHGLGVALQPVNLLYCFIGVFIGTLVGVLPGIGPISAMSLLLPVTLSGTPDPASS